MNTALEKQTLRREVLARRAAMSEPERAGKSARLCRLLSSLPELDGVRTVLGYSPHGGECDLRALYDALRARGVTLAFPVAGADGAMEAYVPGGALIRGRFGILEPDPANARLLDPAALDVVLVPCAGFDGTLRRLGRGGGYYDRYLPRCGRAAAILTGFETQRLPRVPCEGHDAAFSLLVTEAGVFRK